MKVRTICEYSAIRSVVTRMSLNGKEERNQWVRSPVEQARSQAIVLGVSEAFEFFFFWHGFTKGDGFVSPVTKTCDILRRQILVEEFRIHSPLPLFRIVKR